MQSRNKFVLKSLIHGQFHVLNLPGNPVRLFPLFSIQQSNPCPIPRGISHGDYTVRSNVRQHPDNQGHFSVNIAAEGPSDQHAIYPIDAQMAHHQLGASVNGRLCKLDLSNVSLSDDNVFSDGGLFAPGDNKFWAPAAVAAEPRSLQISFKGAGLIDNPGSVKLTEQVEYPGSADPFCLQISRVGILAPCILADHFIVNFKGFRIYFESLDRAGSGPHSEGDLGSFEGGSSGTRSADQSLFVPENELTIGSHIDD